MDYRAYTYSLATDPPCSLISVRYLRRSLRVPKFFVVTRMEHNHAPHGTHEFVSNSPWLALACICILVVAALAGTFGNVIIVVINAREKLKKVESVFMVNLALSDLYVTLVADPMSIIAKLEGESFFDSVPGLCQTIASLCTISCVASMMTIATMSVNRYIYICNNDLYKSVFTRRNSLIICAALHGIGVVLVLLNTAGIGDHSFDHKSVTCIWDRMTTHPYTVAFTVCLVWIPSIITGVCFFRIYLYVRNHRRKIMQQQNGRHRKFDARSFRLAKTLFIIYAVFVTCWAPYALLIAIDYNDEYPHEVHVFITMFAHLHPSLNWLVYYLTNENFAESLKDLLSGCVRCRSLEGFVAATSVQMLDKDDVRKDKSESQESLELSRVAQTRLSAAYASPASDNRVQLPGQVLSTVESESEL